MAFKIKDGLRIGTTDVFDNQGNLLVNAATATTATNATTATTANAVANSLTIGTGLSGGSFNGSAPVTINHSNSVTGATVGDAGATRTLASQGVFEVPRLTFDNQGHISSATTITLTLPAGTVASDGDLTVSTVSGSTGNAIAWGTSTGFSADTAANVTYDLRVGPSLTALASTMTGSGSGFLRKNGADTFELDTNTYLTSAAVGDGSLAFGNVTLGNTNTTVALVFSGAYDANTNIDRTIDVAVGPALGNLAATMTGVGSGFLRKSGADTFTVDNATYLTAESDTLASVTARGASTGEVITLTNGTVNSGTVNTGTLIINGTGGLGVGGNVTVGGTMTVGVDLNVTGNLVVSGNTVTLDTATINVEDHNITLGNVATPTNTTANTGGFTLKGATDKTFTWLDVTDAWTSSENMDLGAGVDSPASGLRYLIDTLPVLSRTTLGATVVNSSLTKLGLTQAGLVRTDANGNLVVDTNAYSITTGTVTSVSGTGTVSGITLTGTVTSSGSLTLGGTLQVNASDFSSQTANTFLAAPNGSSGTPTFRTIVAADVPTLNQNTTGSAATLTTARTISATGDITWTSAPFDGSGDVTGTATLATVNANVGTFNNVTVNAKGLVTAASNVAYLTAETDTLSSVTGRGASTAVALSLTNTTETTSSSTGALVVSGGVAVAKNLLSAGAVINATSAGTGVAYTSGTSTDIATTSLTPVDTWAAATYRSAKYLVQITQGGNYQVSEIMVIHNGTTTLMTEYAVLETGGSLATFTSDLNSGNGRLLVTMGSASSATIKISRTLLAI